MAKNIAMCSEYLLHLAQIYGAAKGLTQSTVSTYCSGSGDFLARLQQGCGITIRRAASVAQWFSDHWPADLDWPADFPRPDPVPDSPYALALSASAVSATDAMKAVREARAALDEGWASCDFEALDIRGRARAYAHLDDLENALSAAGRALGSDGQIACPNALCLSIKVPRYAYDEVVRRYADGRPGATEVPRKSNRNKVLNVFNALVLSGDVRFASRAELRREMRERAREREEGNRQAKLLAQAGARQ